MTKIFYIYLIKRSLYFSFNILMFFGLLDSIFNFISELENLTPEYNIAQILIYVMSSLPHNLIDFIEGACLLGVMLALGLSHQEGNLNVLRTAGVAPLKIVFLSSIGLGTGSFTDRIATIHISISEAMINNLPPLIFLLLIDLWREKRRSHNK